MSRMGVYKNYSSIYIYIYIYFIFISRIVLDGFFVLDFRLWGGLIDSLSRVGLIHLESD
jgi:hypothetical protein